ncbi:PfaD family polyunsaturated fatty acid/polyketide biosynthesis protein [Nostoc sp. UHCC 0252]|uniref:PfaD family polyunsaturated fatty acid/polyketide biosynthesis protein n=1 Tax=Nostoc sp. UHCC 0252 TaxID=3110241 RepID=UPI002B20459C|nr:PfaD family polyunsaturated fatty acid/polyketide biosynthesis protein [Nostoc sp. UHCC 0252]MEA5605294.1 PfaD family polyunsaturated fatty acid/polyketide biosynthesis protein [Nostoc sp. UHCC 0252]
MLLTKYNNWLSLKKNVSNTHLKWQGSEKSIITQAEEIHRYLHNLDAEFYLLKTAAGIALAKGGELSTTGYDCLGSIPSLKPESIGNDEFKNDHQTRFAYHAGAMANGIASVEMVKTLGKQGYLASFGAAGLPLKQVEAAIQAIQAELREAPYAFNLIHSPSDPKLEKSCVDLYLKYGVRTIEASAFMGLSPNLVRYRAVGLSRNGNGEIIANNHIIVKISRREVAEQFLKPAPESLLNQLVSQGAITSEQALLARLVPIASDITVEADSAGHTDNRPLVCLLPLIQALRDRIQQEYGYTKRTRIGAAGGISTPSSALAALAMGADYIVTGSVNQACLESGTSATVKDLLAQVDMADVMMTPAADMFEMGVKVQVLKRGTFYPIRAQKLYEIYRKYQSIEDIPAAERQKIEQEMFHKDLHTVWNETREFFQQRDPSQIEKALKNPKHQMSLMFRWYLGKSSSWAKAGLEERKMDYQIWCGPAMGAFNEWVKGSYLEKPENRQVVDVANHLMRGAAYLYRLHLINGLGINLSPFYKTYRLTL